MDDSIETDDMYANDSESLGVYEEDALDETPEVVTEEHNLISGSFPIMDNLIEWFNVQIDFFSHNDSIDVSDGMSNTDIARQIMVNKLMTLRLTEKRDEITSQFEAYKTNMNGGSNE